MSAPRGRERPFAVAGKWTIGPARIVASLAAALLLAGCIHRYDAAAYPPPQTCREPAPNDAQHIDWIRPDDERQTAGLDEWCATVGPPLFVRTPRSEVLPFVDQLVVVTWNVHVGAGDVGRLIRGLRAGEFTSGRPVHHFVLLLQEARRRDADVPATIARGLPVPHRIDGSRTSADLRRVAEEWTLSLFYAPSMRNGAVTGAAEDRGNAILSTLALEDPAVIELPLERQRRAATAAVVEGRTGSGVRWRLRVVDVHLDTALALLHGGPAAARRRQAVALVKALGTQPDTVIVGGDFNTWLGQGEPALRVLRLAFPMTAPQRRPTWKGPLGLHANIDHIYARGSARVDRLERLSDRFGSDHYPVLGVVSF